VLLDINHWCTQRTLDYGTRRTFNGEWKHKTHTTPKLYTSDLNVVLRVSKTSGAVYPELIREPSAGVVPTSCTRPKSDTPASRSWLSSMLDDLIFPWANFCALPAWCKYAIPFAAPSAILARATQSKGARPPPLLPVNQKVHSGTQYIYVKADQLFISSWEPILHTFQAS
jgi:hypothetical protein